MVKNAIFNLRINLYAYEYKNFCYFVVSRRVFSCILCPPRSDVYFIRTVRLFNYFFNTTQQILHPSLEQKYVKK